MNGDELQGPDDPKKKKTFGQAIADSAKKIQATEPPKKSFGAALEEKKKQLLPVDSTAVAPQADELVMEAEPTVAKKPPSKLTKKVQEYFPKSVDLPVANISEGHNLTAGQKAGSVLWYGYNRVVDAADAAVRAMHSDIPIFTEPGETAKTLGGAVKKIGGQLSDAGGNFVEAITKGTLKEYLKKDFATQSILTPIQTFVENVLITPAKLGVVEPFYIAMEGYQRTPNEVLRKDIQTILPDLTLTYALGGFGIGIARKQILAGVERSSGRLAAELASNTASLTDKGLIAQRMVSLPIEELIAMKKQLPFTVRAMNNATKIVAEAAVAGTAYGLTMQGTPEEKITSIAEMSFYMIPFLAGAHATWHVAGKVAKRIPILNRLPIAKPHGYDLIRDIADRSLLAIQMADGLSLTWSERAAFFAKFADRLDPAEIMARSTNRGIIRAVTPEMRSSLGESGYTYFDRGDGKFDVLTDRTKRVDPEAYAEYPEGAKERAKQFHQAAMQEELEALRNTDPQLAAEVDQLLAEGLEELAATKVLLKDKRSYYKRAVHLDPETNVANRRALDYALAKAENDPNVAVLTHDLPNQKVAGKEARKAFADHVKKVLISNGIKLRDTFWYGGDQFVTFLESADANLVKKIKGEIDTFQYKDPKTGTVVDATTGVGNNLAVADADLSRARLTHGKNTVTEFNQWDPFFSIEDHKHFATTGFVPLQKVLYNGTVWAVREVANKTIHLIDENGNTVLAKAGQVTRTPELEVARARQYPDVTQVLETPIDEHMIPKEPGFVMVPEPTGEPVQPRRKPPTDSSVVEMEEADINKVSSDQYAELQAIEREVFGAKAQEYRNAWLYVTDSRAEVNSPQYKIAMDRIEKMRGELTPEQRNRLLEITNGMSPDKLDAAASAAREFSKLNMIQMSVNTLIDKIADLFAKRAKLKYGSSDDLAYGANPMADLRNIENTYVTQAISRILTELLSKQRHREAGNLNELFTRILSKFSQKSPSIDLRRAQDVIAESFNKHADDTNIQDVAKVHPGEILDFSPTAKQGWTAETVVDNMAENMTRAVNAFNARKIIPRELKHYMRAYMDWWEANVGDGQQMHDQLLEKLENHGWDVHDEKTISMFNEVLQDAANTEPAFLKDAVKQAQDDLRGPRGELDLTGVEVPNHPDLVDLPIEDVEFFKIENLSRLHPDDIVGNVVEDIGQMLDRAHGDAHEVKPPKEFKHILKAYIQAWNVDPSRGGTTKLSMEVVRILREGGWDSDLIQDLVEKLLVDANRVDPNILRFADETTRTRPQPRGDVRMRAELNRDLTGDLSEFEQNRIDINARAHEGQPHYSADPDLAQMQPKSLNRVRIDFKSDFDKAVYMYVRTPEEMINYGPEQRLLVEDRMMKFARKVRQPLKDLEAHKRKLQQEVAKADASHTDSMREIGLEPTGIPGVPNTPFLDITPQKYDGAQSVFRGIEYKKIGKIVDVRDVESFMSPDEKAIMHESIKAHRAYYRDLMLGKVLEMNDNGIYIKMEGSKVRAIGPDGKTVATFDTVQEALEFRSSAVSTATTGRSIVKGDLTGDGGSVQPPKSMGSADDLGGGGLPPNAGNMPDGYIDPYGGPNMINIITRGWNRVTPPFLKPMLAVLRDIAGAYGMDTLLTGGHKFDTAAMRAAAENQRYGSKIQKIFSDALGIASDRIKFVIGNSFKMASSDDLASNILGRRFNATRPSTPTTYLYWNKLTKLAEQAVHMQETPADAVKRVLELVRTLKKIESEYDTPTLKATPEYQDAMKTYQSLVPNKATQDMVNMVQEILTKDVKEADLFEIIGMVEASLNGTVSKADFAAANKMTPKDIKIADDMRMFVNEVAAVHGLDGVYLMRVMDMLSRLNGGTFHESVWSYQKGWNPEQLSFLKQLIKEPSNVGMDRDPFKLMHSAATTSVRSRILMPARDEFMAGVEKVLAESQRIADIESLKKADSQKAASKQRAINKKIAEKTEAYADEVIGKMDGYDHIVNDAINYILNNIAKRMGSSKEFDVHVRRTVLATLGRIYEASAQGGRPKAGAADTMFGVVQLLTNYPIARVVKMLSISDNVIQKAIKEADELQRKGDIPGIQIIIPEDLSGPQSSSQVRRVVGQLATEASDELFYWSGQPAAFKYLSALIYTEAYGRTGEGVQKFGVPRDQAGMLKLARYLELDMFPPATRKEFFRILYYEGTERASHFLAQVSNRHMMVQFGRGMGPAGWGSVFGRLFGTFGTWPLGAWDSFSQNMANRSYKSMRGWAVKYGGALWLQWYIQKETGLDLRGYSINPFDYLTWRGSPTVGLANSVMNYGHAWSTGNQYQMRQYEWEMRNFMPNGSKKKMPLLERFIPFRKSDKNWSSIVTPGSFGAQDHREALKELQQGELMQAILRELSIRPRKAQRY